MILALIIPRFDGPVSIVASDLRGVTKDFSGDINDTPKKFSSITSAVSYCSLDAEPFFQKFPEDHAIVGNALEGTGSKCNPDSILNELQAFWNRCNLLHDLGGVPCVRAECQKSVVVSSVEISRKPDNGLIT
ncbi:MAG TPA: hypothetical protein VNH18_12640 [Bryobacteraceae bacterium]|nr:hypothetical protein [Bryobacteraceae bacterium]